jgi:beta-N-acetylhexosaminidase
MFSPMVIGQLLRKTLRFDGVVISDDLGATRAVASIPPGRRAIDFLLAGGNMIISMDVAPTEAMYQAVLSHTVADSGFKAIVDRSVLRILQAKQSAGLLPCG